MEDGSKAVGLFNRGELEDRVTVKWSDLDLAGASRCAICGGNRTWEALSPVTRPTWPVTA